MVPFNFSPPNTLVELRLPEVSIMAPQPGYWEPVQAAPNIETAEPGVSTYQIGMLIWTAGFLLYLLHQLIGYYIFKKQVLRWGQTVKNSSIHKTFQYLLAEMNITETVTLLISKKAACPMIIGFVKPVLILPCTDYTNTDLQFVIKHELVHFRRHDIWFKLILSLANAVHWFNPLVYLMVREAGKDMELSCDDEVIKGMSFDGRRQYSETILESIYSEQAHQIVLSTYFNGGFEIMKERFKNILCMKKKRTGRIAFLTVLTGMILIGGLVSCSTKNINTGAGSMLLSSAPSGEGTTVTPGPTGDDSIKPSVPPASDDVYDFLKTQDGIEFQTASQKFAEAFFSANKAVLKEYLISPGTITVHEKGNLLNDLEYYKFKWSPEYKRVDGIVIASYEFKLKGEDSVTYLTLEMKKTDGKWKAAFYGLEK